MRFLFILILLLVFQYSEEKVYGQEIIFLEDFEKLSSDRLQKGIVGNALNLRESAYNRKVLKYTVDPSKWQGSFTLTAWVWAEEDYENYNVIDLKIAYSDDSTQQNWQFIKQSNNAWGWVLKGDKTTLDYKPNYKRQNISKDWNLLCMSFDSKREELSLYFNSNEVAIYSLEDLIPKGSVTSIDVWVGGEEKGELGEWDTFNGMIDNVSIVGSAWQKEKVKEYYRQYVKDSIEIGEGKRVDTIRVMSYNIWHGGNETGKRVGVDRIVDVIKESGADIIAMQETYGSGARIADELGYSFYLRSSNISIMSRFPIVETLAAFKPFHNGNAKIQVGKRQIVLASIWLNFPIDYWTEIDKGNPLNLEKWKNVQEGNKKTLVGIIEKLEPYIKKSQTPVIIAGDFNSGSHLDWVNAVKELNSGYIMPFPTSIFLDSLSFEDTFRLVHPNPKSNRGLTWTPINPDTHQDRIDYIYMMGDGIKVIDSQVLKNHSVRYPSDHAAVLTTFILTEK